MAEDSLVVDIYSVQLGHLSLDDIKNPEVVDEFVKRRSAMANVDLSNAEIHIDSETGCITAKTKLPKAVIKHDTT